MPTQGTVVMGGIGEWEETPTRIADAERSSGREMLRSQRREEAREDDQPPTLRERKRKRKLERSPVEQDLPEVSSRKEPAPTVLLTLGNVAQKEDGMSGGEPGNVGNVGMLEPQRNGTMTSSEASRKFDDE